MNKFITLAIVVALVAGGISFYGGMKYQGSKISQRGTGTLNFQGGDMGGRGARMGAGAGVGLGGAPTAGEIIAKDDKSLTLKLRDGGSKIIFFSNGTPIMKFAEGSGKDLLIGQQVTVTGSLNSDGSLTAETLQIRPTTPVPKPTASAPAPAAQSEIKTFTVVGNNFTFAPAQIKVKKGDTVKIVFQNSGGMHDWVVDEFNARTPKIRGNEAAELTFIADKAGTFEYYCSVGEHRTMGMKGNLVVE